MPLPPPLNPATSTVCVTIEIPNTAEDIRNFLGKVYELGQWYSYDRTGDDLGERVAATWRPALQTVSFGCGGDMIRQNPESPCIIESSTDGETWTQIADITLCVDEGYITNIVNNSETFQTIIQQIIGGASGPNAPVDQWTPGSGAIISPPSGCDPNILWGRIGKLVDFMHQKNVDFFEELALYSQLSDKLETVIDILPIIGDAIEAAVNFVTETGDSLLASYQGSYDDTLRDQIVCDLFCIALDKGDCSISLLDVQTYILDRYNANVAPGDVIELLSLVAALGSLATSVAQGGGLVYFGDEVVYAAFLLQVVSVITQDEFFGVEKQADYYIEMMDSVPSGGWELECDECVPIIPPCWDYKVTQYDSRHQADGALAEWVKGKGWKGEAGGGWALNSVRQPIGVPNPDLTRVEITVNTTYQVSVQLTMYRNGSNPSTKISEIIPPGRHTVVWEGFYGYVKELGYRITNNTVPAVGDVAYIERVCCEYIP